MNERTATKHMKGNGAASPEDLERDLAKTRAEMDDTLDAITHRLSPGQLIDQVFDYYQTGPKEYALNLGTQLRDNPIPATLAAIGLSWLFYNSRNPPSYRYRYGEEYTSEGIPEGPMFEESKGSMEEIKERMSGKAADAKARMGRGMDETKRRARSMAEGVRHRGSDMAQGIRRSGSAARDSFDHMMHEQPLVVGLLGIVVGLGLGAALPTTRRERETLGPKRDEMMHRVRDTGREQIEKTRETFHEAVSESSTPPITH